MLHCKTKIDTWFSAGNFKTLILKNIFFSQSSERKSQVNKGERIILFVQVTEKLEK